ncbi:MULTISPECIES: TetR/AcrR family transcriptional regulator [unclassified Streptomyces]|uniref:TetR/AcrR family transcriptional regulator n=1 Tax=Streptomyces sp. SID4945 TaxID=2690285 RepID=UPI00081EE814|nr:MULTISPECIES: TetR/AcrR family transcriptional regulator [unclassified Streptomyces]SCF43530.1 transcriptional regulator, TetR family [Streptomyces sp. LcepLS]
MAADSSSRASAPGAPRAPRADALRNREKLIEAARHAYAVASEGGPEATLEGIAKAAGVGIGTLYRHFPDREALVEAVYAAELDAIVAAAAGLAASEPPERALRAWFGRYGEFVAAKRGMADTLRSAFDAGRLAPSTTRTRVTEAVGVLLAAGTEAGVLRTDVRPDDVTALLLGVFLSAGPRGEQTPRLLDLLVDALLPRG